jgi:hypothetical protein
VTSRWLLTSAFAVLDGSIRHIQLCAAQRAVHRLLHRCVPAASAVGPAQQRCRCQCGSRHVVKDAALLHCTIHSEWRQGGGACRRWLLGTPAGANGALGQRQTCLVRQVYCCVPQVCVRGAVACQTLHHAWSGGGENLRPARGRASMPSQFSAREPQHRRLGPGSAC